MGDKLPKEFIIPNTYNIPVHDQGNKSNCTSHAFATMWEYRLSNEFKEQVLIDVDDLWEKQLKYGTADEQLGDNIEDCFKIANEYGMKFKTASGKKGIIRPNKGIEFISD